MSRREQTKKQIAVPANRLGALAWIVRRELFVEKDSMSCAFSQKEETRMGVYSSELYQCDLRVPGDTGKLFFAGLPFAAREDARSDVDQAGDEAEDGGRGPGAAVARAIVADV
jgi:hypothetical protein